MTADNYDFYARLPKIEKIEKENSVAEAVDFARREWLEELEFNADMAKYKREQERLRLKNKIVGAAIGTAAVVAWVSLGLIWERSKL